MIFLFVPRSGLDSVIAGLKRAKEYGGEGPRHESDRLGVEVRKNLGPMSRIKSPGKSDRGLPAFAQGYGGQATDRADDFARIYRLSARAPKSSSCRTRHPHISGQAVFSPETR